MKNSKKKSFQKNYEDNFRFKRIKSLIEINAYIKKKYDEFNNNMNENVRNNIFIMSYKISFKSVIK